MSTLNYLCRNDVSDEDCYKCIKQGILQRCPAKCPYFDDKRKYQDKKTLKKRKELMKKLGVKDVEMQ